MAVKVNLGNVGSLLSHRQEDCLSVFTVEFTAPTTNNIFFSVTSKPMIPHSFNVNSS